MLHKTSPEGCVQALPQWIMAQRKETQDKAIQDREEKDPIEREKKMKAEKSEKEKADKIEEVEKVKKEN